MACGMGALLRFHKRFGAAKIITTTSADNVDYCKSLGADEVIDYKTQDWADVVADGSVDAAW